LGDRPLSTAVRKMQTRLSAGYLDRFAGVGRLFGRAGLERLQAAHVCVIGVGGVGSWTVEALARSGIGALTLVDLDDVCVTNVNRQLPALDGQIGRPKAIVLAERVRLINPECAVHAALEFYTPGSSARLLAGPFDFVVDAIDRMSLKALLIAACRERGLPVITAGSAGGRRDAARIRIGDGSARFVREGDEIRGVRVGEILSGAVSFEMAGTDVVVDVGESVSFSVSEPDFH